MFYLPNAKLYTNFIQTFDQFDKKPIVWGQKSCSLNSLKLQRLEDSVFNPEILRLIFFLELLTNQRVLIVLKNYIPSYNLDLRKQQLFLILDWFSNLALIKSSNITEINIYNQSLSQLLLSTSTIIDTHQIAKLIKMVTLIGKRT